MEGVTYNLRESLEIFRELTVPISEIRASGGGAKSPLWRQIQADVFGQPVVTLNAEEGPAYGVALLAAVGSGTFRTIQEACAATIRVVNETRPSTAAKDKYERGFAVYRSLYPALQGVFRQIAAVG